MRDITRALSQTGGTVRPLMNLQTPHYCITVNGERKFRRFQCATANCIRLVAEEINYGLTSLSDGRAILFEKIGIDRDRSVRAIKDVNIHYNSRRPRLHPTRGA